jgi:hypothetical protein
MVPLDKIEVDLMAIRLGKLILVECKESGERLVEPNEAREFSGQLARLARLAEHLAASRLVVATSTTFPEDKEPLLVGLTEGWAQKVEWWDADRLLDPPRLIELRGG